MNTSYCAKESCHRHNSAGAESMAVKAARLAEALDEGIRVFLAAGEQNLGDLEMQIERKSRELLRLALKKGRKGRPRQRRRTVRYVASP